MLDSVKLASITSTFWSAYHQQASQKGGDRIYPPGPQDSVVGNEGFVAVLRKKCTPLKTNISS